MMFNNEEENKLIFLGGNGFNINFVKEEYQIKYPNRDELNNYYLFKIFDISINIIKSSNLQVELNSEDETKTKLLNIVVKRLSKSSQDNHNNINIEEIFFIVEEFFLIADWKKMIFPFFIWEKMISNLLKKNEMPWKKRNIDFYFDNCFNHDIFWNLNEKINFTNENIYNLRKKIIFIMNIERIDIITLMMNSNKKIINKMIAENQNYDFVFKNNWKEFLMGLGFYNSKLITTNYDSYMLIAYDKNKFSNYIEGISTMSNIEMRNMILSEIGIFAEYEKTLNHLHGSFFHAKGITPITPCDQFYPPNNIMLGNPLSTKYNYTPTTTTINYSSNEEPFSSNRKSYFYGCEKLLIFGLDILKEYFILYDILDLDTIKEILFYNTKSYFDENKDLLILLENIIKEKNIKFNLIEI